MNTSCNVCLKQFKYPWMLRRHLERKKPCKPPENKRSEENMPTQQKNMPKYAKICQWGQILQKYAQKQGMNYLFVNFVRKNLHYIRV